MTEKNNMSTKQSQVENPLFWSFWLHHPVLITLVTVSLSLSKPQEQETKWPFELILFLSTSAYEVKNNLSRSM